MIVQLRGCSEKGAKQEARIRTSRRLKENEKKGLISCGTMTKQKL